MLEANPSPVCISVPCAPPTTCPDGKMYIEVLMTFLSAGWTFMSGGKRGFAEKSSEGSAVQSGNVNIRVFFDSE